MEFTEYRFDPAYIKAVVDERRQNLIANRGLANLLAFGLEVVAGRLKQDPRRYLDYGVWWWSLKELLNQEGYGLGNQSDPTVATIYKMEIPEETLIAAEEFRSKYLRTQFIYNNKFMVDSNDGGIYTLYDSDMEVVW